MIVKMSKNKSNPNGRGEADGGSMPKMKNAQQEIAEQHHLEDKKTIKWRVDGNVVRGVENTHWRQPLLMNFDSEIMSKWLGLPKKENLPSTFSIEYVRS